MNSLFGLKVLSSPYLPSEVPAIQVRDIKLKDGTSILSPSFRREMDAWLLQRFGKKQVAFMISGPLGKALAMHPERIAMLKNFIP